MKKANMLRKNKDFSYCYRRGTKNYTKVFTMYVAKSKYNKRFGFSVSKKIGNSVVRNKVRRRFKEILTPLLPYINKDCSIIFVARKDITSLSFKEMTSYVVTSLKKAGLIDEKSVNLFN